MNILKEIKKLSDKEIVEAYSLILQELTNRKIIRTKNLVGDLGEFLVLDTYNSSSVLPNLIIAKTNTKAFDAYCPITNERYTIKAISTKRTSSFRDISNEISDMKFDHLIIVKFDDNYQLEHIYQFTWEVFTEHKKWSNTTKSWYLILNSDLIKNGKVVL
jgi:hypothetical protein